MSAHAYYNGLIIPQRKAFRGLSRYERRIATLESTMDQLAESVRTAQLVADDEPRAAARELARLKRSVDRIASDAEALADEIDTARNTLAQLDEVGVGDAVDDDRTLEAIAERVEAMQRLAADAADAIGAALDEIEENA